MPGFDSLPDRIKRKIRFTDSGCWEWIAATSPVGYGRVHWQGNTRESHRVVYALLVRPIPEGMVIDHVCHDPEVCKKVDRECPHRRCQNPAHFRIVTRAANALRSSSPPSVNALKDCCDNGHEYTPETMVIDGGTRRCKLCRQDIDKRRRPRGAPRKDIKRRSGREYRPVGATPERTARDAEIVRLRAAGMTFTAIAAQLGIDSGFASAQHKRLTAPDADWPPDRVKALRRALRLTQEQLGQFLGVTYSAISAWERGTSSPSGTFAAQLDALARQLAA